jgi:hypothetical protein
MSSFPDLSALVVDGGKIKAPYLCGYLNTGILATDSKTLDVQSGPRLWANRKTRVPEDYKDGMNLILPGAVPYLVARTDFISKMDKARFNAVSKMITAMTAENAAVVVQLKEFYYKFYGDDDSCNNCKVSKLFRSEKATMFWHEFPEGNRLLVDVAKIVAANLEMFNCPKTQAARYVKTVMGSNDFERRWGALCIILQRRKQNSCPLPVVEGTKMDFMAFHLFIRCCKGPASDFICAEDALRSTFIGLGDLREASKILAEIISNSQATSTEEQASYGIDEKTQADAVAGLRIQVEGIKEELSEVKTKVGVMNEEMDILMTNIIPAPNRIYVCGYMDKHFAYESTTLPRLDVLRLFGGLVSKLLGEKGLRETIGKEETTTASFASGQWKQRNVYDDRIHLEAFGECFKTLPLHLPGELAKFRREEEYRFKRSVRDLYNEALTDVNKDELFKDVGDTKLKDAGEDREKRERIFIDREQGLWFIFKKEYEVLQRSSSDGGFAEAAFKSAAALYTKRRMDKKNKEDEKKKRKAEAKAAAQLKKRVRKTTTM